MKELVKEVFVKGYWMIGYIFVDMVINDCVWECVEGVWSVMKEVGFDLVLFWFVEMVYLIENGEVVFDQLMVDLNLLSVVMCGNDVLVVGVVRGVVVCNLCILEDIVIIGFDDIELVSVVFVLLIIVYVLYWCMGQLVVCVLMDVLNGM